MSTTFGINKSDFKDFELDENGCIPYWINPLIFEEVAFRNNSGIRWTNNMTKFLPDETKVYALDNSAQGVFTIGDIREKILKQSNK